MRRTVLAAVAAMPLLGALPAATPAHAEPGPLAVDFFLDLADATFDRPDDITLEGAAAAEDVLGEAIPVRFTDSDGGWRMVAGATGRYTARLADQVTMVSRLGLTTTDFVDTATPDKAAITASTEFRYTTSGWTMALQPGLEIVRRATELVQRDTVVDARLSKGLGHGLSLSTTGRYRWRDGLASNVADHEITTARAGLVFSQPDLPRLEMAYQVRQDVAMNRATAFRPTTLSAGPSFTIALPLGELVDFNGSYDYTGTSHSNGKGETSTSERHLLGLRVGWDIAPELEGMQLTASYRCELDDAANRPSELRHAGTVRLALDF